MAHPLDPLNEDAIVACLIRSRIILPEQEQEYSAYLAGDL